MRRMQIEGEDVLVTEDVEPGKNTVLWRTRTFEVKFTEGLQKDFMDRLDKKNKDGSPKYVDAKRDDMIQEFVIGKMRKIKDELVKKDDFWISYLAFRKMLLGEQ